MYIYIFIILNYKVAFSINLLPLWKVVEIWKKGSDAEDKDIKAKKIKK